MDKIRKSSKKILVGIIGTIVVLVGIVLIPYPGPGWLVVFGGLAILATEFEFAARLLHFAKGKYDAWVAWLKKQPWYTQVAVLAFTCAVVVVTVWLLNGFGIAADLLNIEKEWLTSPLFK